MKGSVWLSIGFGAVVATVAVLLLFWVEARQLTGRPASIAAKASAGVVTLAAVVIALARFAVYS